MKELNIGKDFSTDPSGRYYDPDGDASGEAFRESILKGMVESLGKDEKLHIILDDGVESYGSSFLVEGFAGMVKYGYITSDDLLRKLDITYTEEDFGFYKKKIIQYIHDAKYNSMEYKPTI